jgi:hypothetical protein
MEPDLINFVENIHIVFIAALNAGISSNTLLNETIGMINDFNLDDDSYEYHSRNHSALGA